MKTKTFLTLTLVFLLLNSCSKNEETLYNSFSSYSIEFSIADTASNDLLDPQNENPYNSAYTRVYHIVNGELVEYGEPLMDAQFGYKLLEPYEYGNSNYVFCLQAIFADEVQGRVTEPVTYIKWNDTDTDTIKCFIEYTKTSAINKKVWVNGELAWDFEVERSYSRKIDMIK